MSAINNTKRLLCFLLALFILGACGSRGYKPPDDPVQAQQSQSEPTKTTQSQTASPLAKQSQSKSTQVKPQRSQNTSSLFGVQTYGNWCGANHPANLEHLTHPPAPVDALDDACKRHDYCYLKYGDFDCLCDEVFVLEVDNAMRNNEIHGNSRHIARSFKILFQGSPCSGDNSGKALPSKILHDVYNGAKGMVNRIFGSDSETTPAPQK